MLWKVDQQEMSQGRSIRQCFGRFGRQEIIRSRRIRQCFGRLVDREGVSGSALEG